MSANFAPWQQATIEIMLAISVSVACSRYINDGVILHAHTVPGESYNQRNATGEVATTSPPFYNEPHRLHVLCVKAELCTTFKSWSQPACTQSFAPWQQATIEIILAISYSVACSRYTYDGVILHAHPVRGESYNQRNATGEIATNASFEWVNDKYAGLIFSDYCFVCIGFI